MRLFVLALTALVSSGLLAAQADEAVPPNSEAAASAAAPVPKDPEAAPKGSSQAKADREPVNEPARESARYGFQRVEDGFLRFDHQTGRVAFCNPRPEGWGCQGVAEDRPALEREVERLRAEVAELKDRLKMQDEPPRPPQPVPPETKPATPSPSLDRKGDSTFSIPGREHIARAASVVQEAWQHFVEKVTELKNDVLRKYGA